MEKRELGKSGIEVAPICFGGNVFGWTADKKQSFKLLDAFVDAGFDFIDTADTYSWWVPGNSGTESETILGEWLAQRNNRDTIILSTKVGSQNNEHPVNVSKEFILKNVEGSLRRLKTDYIDLYQTHFDDEHTPVEETLSAYQQLIQEGKVRAIGTSNMSSSRILESLSASEKEGLPRYQTIQPEYNLLARNKYEKELLDIAENNQMGVINYSSLASGFLTGKYRSKNDLSQSQRGGAVEKYLNEKGMKVLNALDQISEKHNSTQAAISLAWLLAQPTITTPIVSATSLKQLDSMIQAPNLNLDEEDMSMLNVASSSDRK